MPTVLRRGPTNWQDVTQRCRQRSHGTAKQQARGLKVTPVGKVGFVGLHRVTSEESLTCNFKRLHFLAYFRGAKLLIQLINFSCQHKIYYC